jgi:hypothetical protein
MPILPGATAEHAARGLLPLAESNYEVNFAPESRPSRRVLFPSEPSQSNGIEDARFVPLPERRRRLCLLGDLHRLRRQDHVAAVDRDPGFPAFQIQHAQGTRRRTVQLSSRGLDRSMGSPTDTCCGFTGQARTSKWVPASHDDLISRLVLSSGWEKG